MDEIEKIKQQIRELQGKLRTLRKTDIVIGRAKYKYSEDEKRPVHSIITECDVLYHYSKKGTYNNVVCRGKTRKECLEKLTKLLDDLSALRDELAKQEKEYVEAEEDG